MNAASDLRAELGEGEEVEAIVFGDWGWSGYIEPAAQPVPPEMRGKVLTFAEAEPLMEGWRFNGGFGAPECYAANVWTNRRILWVTQYDGSTSLCSAPRNPVAHMPDMPGG